MARYRKWNYVKEQEEITEAKPGYERIQKANEWAENFVLYMIREHGIVSWFTPSSRIINACDRLEKSGVITFVPPTIYTIGGYVLVV